MKTNQNKRGDKVTTAGATGIFVGVSPNGCIWIAYEAGTFETMCRAFDETYG